MFCKKEWAGPYQRKTTFHFIKVSAFILNVQTSELVYAGDHLLNRAATFSRVKNILAVNLVVA